MMAKRDAASAAGVDAGAIFTEQIRLIYSAGMAGALSAMAVGWCYAVLVWKTAPRQTLLTWVSMFTLLCVVRGALVLISRRASFAPPTVRAWAGGILAIALLTGLMWAYAAVVMFPYDYAEAHLIAAFILVGLPAGAIATFGSWSLSYALYVGSAVLPFAAAYYLRGGPLATALLVTAVVFVVFMLRVARWFEQTLRDNIMHRIQIEHMAQGLEKSRDAAEAANRAKSSFLANMSHEVRTPLNAVIGMNELLLESTLNAKQKEYSQSVRESALSLLDIIDSVIDMSRIETGRLDLREERFAIRAVAAQIERMYTPVAQRKDLVFTLTVAPSVPYALFGDATRWRQVLGILVDNAIKFTERGNVSVSIDAQPGDAGDSIIRAVVVDTGIGIPAADRPLLFQTFTQLDASSTRRHGGTGMGLRIAAELSRLMRGDVGVESEPGRGSSFWFTVRMKLTAPDAAMQPPDPEVPLASQGFAGAKILLVEDNPVNQAIARTMLQTLGCQVETAVNGIEALRCMENARYDLVFMDCQMPEMDGYAATAEIRLRERGGAWRVPIIALTANALEGDRERCLAAGMDDYLAKPYVRAQIVTLLQRWLPRFAKQG